jgi:hypothetical protein
MLGSLELHEEKSLYRILLSILQISGMHIRYFGWFSIIEQSVKGVTVQLQGTPTLNFTALNLVGLHKFFLSLARGPSS